LDPLVSSYFKNQGQQRTLIELIQERSAIQETATLDMRKRFADYDLQLQEVLIGTPHSPQGDTQIETILSQLRERQTAVEQLETYRKQQEAQGALRSLNEAKAVATRQTDLTNSKVQIDIEVNQGQASAQRAKLDAERSVTLAGAEAQKIVTLAGAEAEKIVTLATADGEKEARTRIGEAIGIAEIRKAYGSPQVLVAREAIKEISSALKEGKQEIVPRTLINFGGNGSSGDGDAQGDLFTKLLTLVLSDKLKLTNISGESDEPLGPQARNLRDRIVKSMEETTTETAVPPTTTPVAADEGE
jgi:uncharacterized membrane protein YqiK